MIFQSLCGILVFVMSAWLISENKQSFPVKTVVSGIFLQLLGGALLLNVPLFREFFLILNRLVSALEQSTSAGTAFVFGYLGGGPAPFEIKTASASFVLAFRALPLVLLMSALSALLFYWKILPFAVTVFSRVLERTMKLGGAEGLGVSANIFVGMIESPLLIRPYISKMTKSELFTLMTCGMATIAGTVMVLYAGILRSRIPDIMGHILVASIISVPAAVTVSKIMVPETEPLTSGKLIIPDQASSSMDAISKGTLQGIELVINITAMLIVLTALVALANLILGFLPKIGGKSVTLQLLLGYVMTPLVWLMGIPWKETLDAGALMGTKTVLNELLAYINLSNLPNDALSPRSVLIITYGMCGFANPGSLGIMIGGLGTMVPERRHEIVSLGFRSILAGTLATSMTGAVVGLLTPV